MSLPGLPLIQVPLKTFTPPQVQELQQLLLAIKKNDDTLAQLASNPPAPSGFTPNRALRTDSGGSIAVSGTTDTELGFVSGVTSAIQTQLNATEKTANKNVANGYAGYDANSRIQLTALPIKIGWISWVDNAGAITINGTGGNITLSVGFRTGTAAGDYTLTSGTAFANTFWAWGGISRTAANNTFFRGNNDNPSHTASVYNFYNVDLTGTPVRCSQEGIILAAGTV